MFSGKNKDTLLWIGLIITVIGIVTGKYLFFFLILPLGWFGKKKNNKGL
ncbi:hypothetical protein [Robertkochia solimangrovi]|nr:hypothetical protein [Robertkochia solimangrovi]